MQSYDFHGFHSKKTISLASACKSWQAKQKSSNGIRVKKEGFYLLIGPASFS